MKGNWINSTFNVYFSKIMIGNWIQVIENKNKNKNKTI